MNAILSSAPSLGFSGKLRLALPVLLGLVFTTGCVHFTPKRRSIRHQDLAHPDGSKLTSRFQYSDGSLEYPPTGMSPELVTDTAYLAASGSSLCVRFTMRTGAKHDAPFGEWNITANGEPVFPQEETIGQSSVEVATERTIVDATVLTGGAFGNLSITEPDTAQIQIVERAAWFCPRNPVVGQLSFQLRRSFNNLDMRQGFIWTIVP